jgi:hypothetical protein
MACEGSGRFVGPIIEQITDHHSAYIDDTPYLHDSTTDFVNILLIADAYEDGDAAAVQGALEDAFTAGITTYVVAVGNAAATPAGGFMTQLDDLADWGSGGAEDPRLAPNSGQLDTVLQEIIANHSLPCCASIDCSHVGGADGGGGVDGTDSDSDSAGDAADWGGQDGTAGDAGDAGSADGTAGSSNTDTETGGALDDDGGCTCRTRSARPSGWAWALLVAGICVSARRRRRAR